MNLLFASHNQNKVNEISALLDGKIKIQSLNDVGIFDEIEEYGKTLTENALIKARFVFDKTKQSCFADDTGLLVDALNGAPGVLSARYAGVEKNADKNMDLLLQNLIQNNNRKAKFVTTIALLFEGKEILFEGFLEGEIITEKKGNAGFGYDPIFLPKGFSKTLAEMNLEEKNKISHRAIAFEKLKSFLLALNNVS